MGKIEGHVFQTRILPVKERFEQGGRSEEMYLEIQSLANQYLKK